MAKPNPDYRTDTLFCPLNKGKRLQVVELVLAMRRCAKREARLQWQQFFSGGWSGFQSVAKQGWSRPWTQDETLTVSHGQMVMSQVAASLQGHFGNVKNTYAELVAGSALPPNIRHQLHFINKIDGWFLGCPISLSQRVSELNAKTGQVQEASRKIVISAEVRHLAKVIIRKALSMHRRPHFKAFQPQIDQRSCLIQSAHTAQHQLWLVLGQRKAGARLNLPLQVHPGFLARQDKVNADQAIQFVQPTQSTTSQSIPGIPVKPAKARNPYPSRFALAKTVRLILSEDHTSVSVATATDMREAFEQSRASYQVKTPVLALDAGLCTFLASHEGDLLGRGWIETLSKIDRILTGIARHRQARGLPIKSERYVFHSNRLRGYLKTEVNRIFNRLVKTKAPGHLVLEALDFSNARLSRRLNRLIRNFGQRLIREKLLDLEKQFGITSEFRNPAYTSKQCHACGYIDDRNRSSQARFHCRFCNKKIHADVNGARVLFGRRSTEASSRNTRHRVRSALIEQTMLFNERFTRPRGGPADPRFSNPYFKGWAGGVRSPEAGMLPSPCLALA